MSWVVRSKPHYKIIYSCKHIVACACGDRLPVRRWTYSEDMCPDCLSSIIVKKDDESD